MIRDRLRRALGRIGVELPRTVTPGRAERPIGVLRSALEDLRARGFTPGVVVDVGANRGDWSRTVASVFPGAQFLLLEPLPGFERDLVEFCRAHPGSQYLLAAAGAEPGRAEIDMILHPDGTPTSGSTFLNAVHEAHYRRQRVSVPVVTLDGLIEERRLPRAPDLLKVDVEGFELEVLRGATSLFGRTDLIILEASLCPFWGQPILHQVLGRLAELGYVLYDVVGFNRRPRDGTLGQLDVCLVREGSALRRNRAWAD